MKNKKLIIGVIGGSECSQEIAKLAYETGYEIGKAGFFLVCGGLGGVMEHAARGAKDAGGTTIGILPGPSILDANKYIDIPIATALSHARNAIIARTADILIAIGGKYGTLSEIGLANAAGKPVYGLKTWDVEGVTKVSSPKEFMGKIR